MATLEKPKLKKSRHSVPSTSKLKHNKETCVTTIIEPKQNIEQNINDCSISICETLLPSTSSTSTILDDKEMIVLQEKIATTRIETALNNPTVEIIVPLKEDCKIITSYPQLPCSETSEMKQEEYIKPFTEMQLSALYNNQEILASKQFTQQFIDTEVRGVNGKTHLLYELITSYLVSRDKLKEITMELNQLKTDCIGCQNQLWVIESASINGKAQCLDNSTVNVVRVYKTAKFQRNLLETLLRIQNKIKRLTNNVYTLHAYNCCLFKLKIENYLDGVFKKCYECLNINEKHVTLLDENAEKSNEFKEVVAVALQELRLCISVLFYFQRQLHKEKNVLMETRQWLTNAISLLLRVANWQDHMYLLNHVLRCPAGIHTWAINYIQIPSPRFIDRNDSPFADRYVNHIVAVLSVILMPIEKRNEFLEQIISSILYDTRTNNIQSLEENTWVLVDSDGESSSSSSSSSSDDENNYGILNLKENDLVALLNQVPFDDLFRAILLIEHKDNVNVFNGALLLTEHHVLRLIAFSSCLIQLLNEGLVTYDAKMRYNQFAKRLCRLMRHILQYVSDTWEVFRATRPPQQHDPAMLHRLQVEFDALFIRAACCLYRTRTLGSWQFLATVPFHMISLKTLWHFFYILHQDVLIENDYINNEIDYKNNLSDIMFKQQFYDRLCIMPVEQSYYLLNTFGNMIMARSPDDKDFIQFATLNLLQIGFSDIENQESCRKCAAILLANITQRYPYLISDILLLIRNSIDHLESLIFLFSELPIYLWKPIENDIDILTIWLVQNPIDSVANFLARKILLNLNWNFSINGELFLPLSLHRQIAILILEAVEKHSSQIDCYYMEHQHQQQEKEKNNSIDNNNSFMRFSWSLMYQLRLHAVDRDTLSVHGVPDLIQFDVIQRGVRAGQPLACFCAVVMTTVGHLLPLVCSEALTYLETLTSRCYKYDATLIALYYIVPLFLDTDALHMCTTFNTIIQQLLNADKTYLNKIAKTFITIEFPGTILKYFSILIQMHIYNTKWHELYIFWVKTLISIPSWNQHKGILYLLNNIISVSFFIPEKYHSIELLFNELLLKKENDKKNNSSNNSSLLSWVPSLVVGNSQLSGSCMLLAPGGITSEHPWLTYLIISLEHQHSELKTGLWPQLLKQLYTTKGKTNIDQSLKKAANILKIPSYSSNSLCIYRWSQLALDAPIDHPLLPLIWQKFFSLYLTRVPGLENCGGSVGNKFFDGVVNTMFLKKIKKRLQESIELYQKQIDSIKSNESPKNMDFYQKCFNIFKAYLLWLEEPIIMEATLYLPSLPPQYEPIYLSNMIENKISPWMELINYDVIKNACEQNEKDWIQFCSRTKKYQPQLQRMDGGELKDPIERILRRLNAYDKPIAPPTFQRSSVIIPTITIRNPESISDTLQDHIKRLQQFAEIYSLQVSEHISLNSQYNELIEQLYTNKLTKVTMKKVCKSTCSGAANITMTFTESKMNDNIKHQIDTNRLNYGILLKRSLQPATVNMCLCCASFEQTIDSLHSQLCESNRIGDAQTEIVLRQIGVELFYYLLACFKNDELRTFPPTQHMFHNCIEKLGQSFVRPIETEQVRLFRNIVQTPSQSALLIPHFATNNINQTNIFLQLYQEISEQFITIPDISLTLISKFNISNWLSSKKLPPRLIDRSKCIQLIFQSLCCKFDSLEKPNLYANINEMYRRHLLEIFQFDFPNHYGEILMLMLQYSGQQTLPIDVWFDVANVLAHPVVLKGAGGATATDSALRRHATNQKILRLPELQETVALLARYFCNERLQFGLYGLYPKYRPYVDALALFMGQTYFAYTVATALEACGGSAGELSDTLVARHLWPKLLELFAPWLLPYSVQECRDATAAWIQQLTDDRAVLLPWIQADVQHAQQMFTMFIQCVRFINDTLPAAGNTLLCLLWQFYATHFAHGSIKEHVLIVVHNTISQINWERFWPSLNDLEMMLKVIDQYIPECHTFLGKLFLDINWHSWLINLVQHTNDYQVTSRVHHCLLHLLVKLSNEPSVRQNDKSRVLLERSREFNTWHFLDVQSLQTVLDWYIMSCDNRVVLMNPELIKQIDNATFQLLKNVSYYNENEMNTTSFDLQIITKRQCFLRAFIKMLINCSSRYKQLLSGNPQQFSFTLKAQLDYLENILQKVPDENKYNDSDILIKEFLLIVNNSCLSQLSCNCINQWMESRTANTILLCSILRNAAHIITNDDDALGSILEQALCSYFNGNTSSSSSSLEAKVDWNRAIQLIYFGSPRHPSLEITLIKNGRLLTLYAILLKKITCLTDDDPKGSEILLETLVNWLTQIKGTDLIEDKLPLFWAQVIRLSLKLCNFGNEEKCSMYLRKFVHQHLLLIAENKSAPTESNALSWGRGLLGAIGLIKQTTVSLQCRFLCKSLAAYILAQLPDAKGKASTVRCFSGASGPVGQPGGNSECARILLKLDSCGTTPELKSYVELSLKQIQDPQNSLNNAEDFLSHLVNIIYTKQYLELKVI